MTENHISEEAQSLPTRFHSILFPGTEIVAQETSETPAFFHDLNLDQVVQAITARWQDYNLSTIFYTQPSDLGTIAYRQDVMRDLESSSLMPAVQAFSGDMRQMRATLPRERDHDYKYQSERCFLMRWKRIARQSISWRGTLLGSI